MYKIASHLAALAKLQDLVIVTLFSFIYQYNKNNKYWKRKKSKKERKHIIINILGYIIKKKWVLHNPDTLNIMIYFDVS